MNKLQSFELSKGITDLIIGMETDLIANIAAYLAAGKIDEPTAQWKIKKLAELGKLTKANAKTIAEYAKGAPELLDVTLKRAAVNAIKEFQPGYKRLVEEGLVENRRTPPDMSEGVKRVLTSLKKQARKDLNLVNTRMRIEAKNAAMKVINRTAERAEKQEYINMLNKAAGKVVTGVEARQAALRECIAEMTEKGIPAFTDSAGRKWTPEAYVNMCIRSTVNNVTAETQFAKMDDYELDLIEVSSHNGARPLCAKDQGKIFSRKNRSGYTTDLNGKRVRFYSWRSSSYGKPDGILGINCGHHITPFLQGISVQTYFPYDEEENAAQYKKIQEQRRLEREVRKSKRECSSLVALDDKEGFDKAAYKLKQKEQRLKQYCNDNGLTYRSDRTATPGYGRSEASKVTAGYKRALEEEKLIAELFDVDKNSESIIIKLKGKLSDRDARRWYLQQTERIPDMIDKTIPLEGQAKQAFELRNKFKIQTRDLMKNQEMREQLDTDEKLVTFEELLEDKMARKKMTREQALKDIIKSASKTRKSVNKYLGLGG